MGKLVLTDCYVGLGGIDFSDHSSSAELGLKKASVDTTNFGTGGGKESVPGLFEGDISITLQQDFSPASVNSTLYTWFNNETVFGVEIRPHHGAVSASNPKFTANVRILDYQPISGKVGDLSDTKVKFEVQGLIAMATS